MPDVLSAVHPQRFQFRRLLTLCVFALAFAVATPALAAQQFSLKVGKSVTSVTGYSFANTSPGAGATRRRGAVAFSALHVLKGLDSLTPTLLADHAKGKVHPKLVLTVSDGGKKLFEIELKNASIVSVAHDSKRKVSEDVAFNYEEVKWTVFTPKGKVTTTWKVEQGQK